MRILLLRSYRSINRRSLVDREKSSFAMLSHQARLVERQSWDLVRSRGLRHSCPLAEAATHRLVVDSVCHLVVQDLASALVEIHQSPVHDAVPIAA